MRTTSPTTRLLAAAALAWMAAACGDKADRPPATTTGPPPRQVDTPPEPPTRTVPDVPPVEASVDRGEDLNAMSDPENIRDLTLDEVNRMVLLEDVHFNYDSAVLEPEARRILDGHAETLQFYPDMTILIEGHCDERGTVEYNLALGERRANAVYNYLMSLGIAANRMRTISYGKEFPLDPGHNEAAWAKNRRGRFEITAK